MSSQKNGPKAFSGARGKKYAMEVLERPGDKVTISDKEVVEMLEQDGVSRLRKLTRAHDELAVETLVDVCEDQENAPSARVSAAKAILDYGHGKPVPVIGKSIGAGTGLRINIMSFFNDKGGATSEPVTVEVAAEELASE